MTRLCQILFRMPFSFTGLALLTAALLSPAAAQTKVTSSQFHGVVELFTSQGCASCPPADTILARISDRPGILALSYNVDYWDYIGWKDTLASRQNADRQRAYAHALGNGSVYTPQLIINGTTEFVGTHDREIEDYLEQLGLSPDSNPAGLIEMSANADTLSVHASVTRPEETTTPPILVFIIYQDWIETPVLRGENSGHRLINQHAVHEFRVVGTVSYGKPLEIEMPISMLHEGLRGDIGCAALLQSVDQKGKPGRILAAARMEFAQAH